MNREKLYEIIFEADTKIGKAFDIILLVLIIISVTVVMLESIPNIFKQYSTELYILEWIITGFFTIEYIIRILIVKRPFKYITGFFGIIDLLSILPSFLELFISGAHSLMVIRAIRLLRVFRILKLSRFTSQGNIIIEALKISREKISVFLFGILMITIIVGTLMYLIEGSENGFTSIPRSIYWAIVTITTVGFGDITPQTAIGQTIAGFLMIIGYAIIAVPTGIVSAAISKKEKNEITTQVCPNCIKEGHDKDAKFCKFCGTEINPCIKEIKN